MQPFSIKHGKAPIILAMPHGGCYLPPEIADRLSEEGRVLRDTDWHIEKLYDGLLPEASVVQATFHRSVIDANRNPSGDSLYPGAATTELVPTTNFDGTPLWQTGREPGDDDIRHRLATFHAPYHAALRLEIERLRARHGFVVVYDCHSIRSHIPRLFEGKLPDFNIGSDGVKTCSDLVEKTARDVCAQSGRSFVVNGRFRGGWTTRHYGQPDQGIHAVQMEVTQASYLAEETPPFSYDAAKAEPMRRVLGDLLKRLTQLDLSSSCYRSSKDNG